MDDDNYLNKIDIFEYTEWCVVFNTKKYYTGPDDTTPHEISLWNWCLVVPSKLHGREQAEFENDNELINWSRTHVEKLYLSDAKKKYYYMYFTTENWKVGDYVNYIFDVIKNNKDKWIGLFDDCIR